MTVLSFLALEVLIGEGHFEEVHSESIHEKEYSKKRGEDASDIGKNID